MRLTFANGHVAHAGVVIGADGVRSLVRKFVTGADASHYSGTSAFRGIVPIENLPSLPDPEAIQFWMGPDAHLLHYAIGGERKAVNFFAVVEGPQQWLRGDRWLDDIEPGVALYAFKGWHPAVTEMIGAVEQKIRWGYSSSSRWRAGRAAAPCYWGTPPMACCRTMAREQTLRSKTRSPWLNCCHTPRRVS